MKTDTEIELAFFAEPGRLTRVSDAHAHLLAGLPRDVESLCAVVQGLIVHPQLTSLYDFEAPDARKEREPELRSLTQMLEQIELLDPRPLAEPRPASKKLLGTCRSFSALLCGLLRYQRIPARSRCGFARYFIPGRGEDHWVCEVWSQDAARWVLVDAQLDAVQREAFRITLNPLDVDRDQFLPGGLVWEQCRRGDADWNDFGLLSIAESGMWFVIGDFVRDVAALNKTELLPWDIWGLMGQGEGEDRFSMKSDEVLASLSKDDVVALDRVADSTASDVDLEAVRLAFSSDARFRVPPQVLDALDRQSGGTGTDIEGASVPPSTS